jgi:hypothetical protein
MGLTGGTGLKPAKKRKMVSGALFFFVSSSEQCGDTLYTMRFFWMDQMHALDSRTWLPFKRDKPVLGSF